MTQQEILDRTRFIAELLGLALSTQKNYSLYIRLYQEHFGESADELDIIHVQEYLHHLYSNNGLKKTSLDMVNSALRFLYRRGIEMPMNWESVPRHGKSRRLPEILTREGALPLLDCWGDLAKKVILMTTL